MLRPRPPRSSPLFRRTAPHGAVVLGVLALLVAGSASHASAQASLLVEASDRLFRADLAALTAQGVTDRPVFGLGFLTRREAARIVVDARAGLARLEARAEATRDPDLAIRADAVRATLARLAARLAPDLAALEDGTAPPPMRAGRMEVAATWYDDHDRPYPNNFLGDVDARTQPLGGLRQGRTLADGWDTWTEASASLQTGAPLALHLQLRVDPDRDDPVTVQQAYARLAFLEIGSLTAGRADVTWGQSRRASMTLSGNARSPWSLRLSSDRPFTLPGFLSALGPIAGDGFWADLGAGQNFPGANLMGWNMRARPHPRFEVGLAMLSQFGGEGAPEYGPWDVVKDLLFAQVGVRQFSNKVGGFDFRWRAPDAAGLSVYGEFVVDDLDLNPGRLPEWVVEDVGHVYGVELARLTPDGGLGGWAEFHHTGHRFYRHVNFISGVTYQQDFVGNPLGPDGDGVYAGLDIRPGGADLLEIELGWERRSRDKYWVVGSEDPFNTFPGDDGWDVAEDFPEESRVRAVATWRRAAGVGPSAWMVRAGLERIGNFAWEEGQDRTLALVEIRLPVTGLLGVLDP